MLKVKFEKAESDTDFRIMDTVWKSSQQQLSAALRVKMSTIILLMAKVDAR